MKTTLFLKHSRFIAACLAGLLTGMAHARGDTRVLDLETHAAFFSSETNPKTPLDPQVFVAAPGAPAGTGPQGIRHAEDLRNALIGDAPTLPLMNASGKPLDMTLGAWLDAKGQVILTDLPDGREKVSVALSGLKPGGRYSLFENHFDRQPVGFTPMDDAGTDNNVVADAQGRAAITTFSPAVLTHANAVLVVYHSDGQYHGRERGDIGVTAHHQLIVRPD